MPPISTSVLGRFGPGWSGLASLGCSAIALAIGLARQAREHAQAAAATAGD